jgi:PRA1 family protein 1
VSSPTSSPPFLVLVPPPPHCTQRKWPEFFERFSVPKADWAAYERRVFANLFYFRSNYALLSLLLALYTLLTNLRLVLALLLIVPAWVWAVVVRHGRIRVGDATIHPQQSLSLLAAASALLLFLLSALLPLLFAVLLCTAAVLAHASLRPSNIRANVGHAAAGLRVRMGLVPDPLGGVVAGALGAGVGGKAGAGQGSEDGGAAAGVDPEAGGPPSPDRSADHLRARGGGSYEG